MVQSGSARSVENTRFVLHDSVGVDGDGDNSLGDGGLELVVVRSWNIGVSRNLGDWSSSSLASSLDGGVRVGGLGLDSVVSDVLEGVVHPTTVATMVSVGSGAVNQLLLGEGGERVTSDLVGCFSGHDGGESPAGTALSLVLDGDDGALLNPVHGGFLGWLEVGLLSGLLNESVTGVLGEELFLGEIGELIKSHGVALGGHLLGGKSEEVLVEDCESVGSLRRRSVALSVLHGPLGKSGVDWSWDVVDIGILGLEKTGSNEQSCGSNNDENLIHFLYFCFSLKFILHFQIS